MGFFRIDRAVLALRALAVAALVFLPGAASANEAYYVLVFGSQQDPLLPRYSHSFAVFVRAYGGTNSTNCYLEYHTISWLPENLGIRTWAVLPECGRNFNLHPTMEWIVATRQCLGMWGPYRIDKDLHSRALAQVGLLQSGRVSYKAIDFGYPSEEVSNCIHAISPITGGSRLLMTAFSFGESASYAIVQRMCPWILDGGARHPWVAERLGLSRYPIRIHSLDNPP